MNRIIILFIAMAAVVAGLKPEQDNMLCGIVRLQAENPHTQNVTGDITIIQKRIGGPVYIQGEISGLTSGLHGFHVHTKGDLRNGCQSAGPHFDPTKMSHGGPTHDERHVGDLGNIQANEKGVANIDITDRVISLSGPNSIFGRAIVIHADRDDLGLGHSGDSSTTGNSGARVACGIIGVLQP